MEIYVINSNIAIIFLWYGMHVFCVNESRLFIFDVGNSRQKRQAWHRGHWGGLEPWGVGPGLSSHAGQIRPDNEGEAEPAREGGPQWYGGWTCC